MKLKEIIDANDAINALIPQLKSHSRLAFRLTRIQDKFRPDVERFSKAKFSIVQENGIQVVHLSSPQVMVEGAKVIAQDEAHLELEMLIEEWDKVKGSYPTVTEISRDFWTIVDPGKQKEVTDTLNQLLDEDLSDINMTVKIELFDGVEANHLGEIIKALGPLVVDTD